MIGTWPGRKDLGIIDGYNVFMVYESLIIFFIPVFKFGKRYYAQKNSSTFEIDQETGKAIERGETVSLHFNDTSRVAEYTERANAGNSDTEQADESISGKICMRCGFKTFNETYSHCPMCGNKLVHE